MFGAGVSGGQLQQLGEGGFKLSEAIALQAAPQHVQIQAQGGATGTDANMIQVTRSGVVTGLNLGYLHQAWRLWHHYSDERARGAFRYSLIYLTGLFAALFLDRLL